MLHLPRHRPAAAGLAEPVLLSPAAEAHVRFHRQTELQVRYYILHYFDNLFEIKRNCCTGQAVAGKSCRKIHIWPGLAAK